MADHNDLGKQGEVAAVAYLRENGYEILEQNFVFQKAEIDIIARKQDWLIVVEVKTRSTVEFGSPEDFVNKKKIKLLVKAIDEYVQQSGLDLEIRFDIIAVVKENGNFNIDHLEDAFYHF
ncbi:YraN family protein [Flavobacterium sp. GCM10023249]|uniref:YraN family protein n=1 Tax=unclassified Flavobacterium TaxID=196869 RepID=UPI0036179B52